MFWESRSREEDETLFLVEDGRHFSYTDIFTLGDQLVADLARDVVLILCDRSHETVAAYIGALRHGLVPLLVDLASSAKSLERTIEAYRPRYIFGNAGSLQGGYPLKRELGAKALLEAASPSSHPIHEKLALLIPTSGSTGDPKCVRLSAANIEACTHSVTDYLGLTSDRVSISLLPFHYSYGLSVLHNVVFTRSKLVLTEKSVLDRGLWQLFEDEKVTDLSGVPFMFEIMRRMKFSDTVLENLTCVTQAGGRLDPKLTRHFVETFGSHGIAYFTMYGQTEAAPRISYVPPQMAVQKLGSVGIPIACGKALIAETGAPSGEGELLYTGPNVCLGYAVDADDLSKGDAFKGKLYTGDQVSIDDDGYITIVGRKKRFIKLHGISVNLDHVESVLKGEGLACMVTGKEDKLLVCVEEMHREKLSAVLAANFNFHPTAIRIVTIDSLPRTPSGKPDYMWLADQYL